MTTKAMPNEQSHSPRIGTVDSYQLACDLITLGATSIAEAEAAGAWVTSDWKTRQNVNFWLELIQHHQGLHS